MNVNVRLVVSDGSQEGRKMRRGGGGGDSRRRQRPEEIDGDGGEGVAATGVGFRPWPAFSCQVRRHNYPFSSSSYLKTPLIV